MRKRAQISHARPSYALLLLRPQLFYYLFSFKYSLIAAFDRIVQLIDLPRVAPPISRLDQDSVLIKTGILRQLSFLAGVLHFVAFCMCLK